MDTTRPNAYSYIRMSTRKQIKGHSLKRQLEWSESYCKKHNLILDNTIDLKDIGLSGYKGEHLKKGNLGKFIELIDKGKIEKGSFLLVESLDRLSRMKVIDAVKLFIGIIEKGIAIVTYADEVTYSVDNINENVHLLNQCINIMFRGYDESNIKKQRLRKSWDDKRKNLDKKKLTSICPHWLKLNSSGTEFEEIPERAKLIKDIYQFSLDGLGNSSIAKRLNDKGVKTWRKGNGWHGSYIHKILKNRSVMGEFQPYKDTGDGTGKREPEGDPIPNYYPPIISESMFYQVTEARDGRNKGGVRIGKRMSNLFSRIAKCVYCGSSMNYVDKGWGERSLYLVCSNAQRGKGCEYVSWHYQDFELSFLTFVKELNLSELFNKDNTTHQIKELKEKKFSEQLRLKKINDKLSISRKDATNEKNDELRDIIREDMRGFLDDIKEVKRNIKDIENRIIQKSSEYQTMIDHQKSITDLITKMDELDGEDLYFLRTRVAQHIRNLVEKIEVAPLNRKVTKQEYEKYYDDQMAKGIKGLRGRKRQEMIDVIDQISDGMKEVGEQKNGRSFRVFFKGDNGGERYVEPNFDHPSKFRVMSNENEDIYKIRHGKLDDQFQQAPDYFSIALKKKKSKD
jgi:hypothetical protein